MLFLVLSDLLFFFIFLGIGDLASRHTFLKVRNDNVFLSFFLGMSLSALFFSVVQFFLPLTVWTLAPVILAGLFGCAGGLARLRAGGRFGKILRERRWVLLAAAIAFFMICYECSKAEGVSAVDTLFYHALCLSWMNAYKIVPGIANLFANLGFNSLYLQLAAGLDVGPWDKQMSNVLYSLFYTAFMFYAATDVLNWTSRKGRHALPFILSQCVMLVWFFSSNTLDDPSLYYDKPTLAMISICLQEMLLIQFSDSPKSAPESLFFFAAVAFGMKLLGALTVIFCFAFIVYGYVRKRELSFFRLVRLCALPLFIFLIYVIRNLIQSGYPFYQSPFLRVEFPWTLPHWLAVSTYDQIHYGSRWDPIVPNSEFMRASFMVWFPQWFGRAFEAQNIQFPALTVVSLALFVRSLIKRRTESLFYYALIFANIAFWFLSAPLFRFGNGFFYDLLAVALFFNADLLAKPLEGCGKFLRNRLPALRKLGGVFGKSWFLLAVIAVLLLAAVLLVLPRVQDTLILLAGRLKGKALSAPHWKNEMRKCVRCCLIVAAAMALLCAVPRLRRAAFALACYATAVFFACQLATKKRNLLITIPVKPEPVERRLACGDQDLYVNVSVKAILCGDAELPCTPQWWFNSGLRLFDKDDMGKGFYIEEE